MSSLITDSQGLSIISCRQCRDRKVRCSRQIPKCKSCTKRNCECFYPQTQRKTSTKLNKKRKNDNTRFYGLSSVNRVLFEVGMPFCNVDYELENKLAPSHMKKLTSSLVYQKYIEDPQDALAAIKRIQSSVGCSLFEEIVDLGALEHTLSSGREVDYQGLILTYAVIIVSERFVTPAPDVADLIDELTFAIEECPDCLEKVSALILLADYYHYNFKIETAWKRTFLATSIAYALGLHLESSKVWPMLVLHDALLCSIVGRPSSIKAVDSQRTSNACHDWGEIAVLLRDSNEILLAACDWTIEKVISLDFRFNDLIERVKNDMNKSSMVENPNKTLLGYLKLGILTASRVKLIFSVYTKNEVSATKKETLKSLLDQNCCDLTQCLRGVFKVLTSSGMADQNNPFFLRSQCFLAYCSIFQGLLLQLHFCSTQEFDSKKEAPPLYFPLPRDTNHEEACLPSLRTIEFLLADYDTLSKSVHFCHYMLDVFNSFRVLLNRKNHKLHNLQEHQHGCTLEDFTADSNSHASDFSDASKDVTANVSSLPYVTDDIADWITACFAEEVPNVTTLDHYS